MKKISLLNAWLDREDQLRSFIDLENRNPNSEWGGFLSLDIAISIHESVNLEAESLSNSWNKVHEYVEQSLKIVNASNPLWLDSEEAELIKIKLGEPPPLCYPIYIVTVWNCYSERYVYIGKTSSDNGRFRGGHIAFTKLHHPKYNGFGKRLYLGAIVFLADDKEYLPLEWIKPLYKAEENNEELNE